MSGADTIACVNAGRTSGAFSSFGWLVFGVNAVKMLASRSPGGRVWPDALDDT
jgi:hypothetical protein